MQFALSAMLVACLVSVAAGVDYNQPQQLEEYVEPAPVPRPYSFNIRAGRFPGNVDRQHYESGDAAGVVRGSYSYIGPRQQIRTVDYIADANGFHPLVHNPVQDTPAVAQAKLDHADLFQKIAQEHARIGQERAAQRAAQGPEHYPDY